MLLIMTFIGVKIQLPSRLSSHLLGADPTLYLQVQIIITRGFIGILPHLELLWILF